MDERVNIPALYKVWLLVRIFRLEACIDLHVAQARVKAFGRRQFQERECLEKLVIVKLYASVL